MLTEREIEALAKVDGVKLTSYVHGEGVWDTAIYRTYVVLCVGPLGKTKREAMNKAWEKYVARPDL